MGVIHFSIFSALYTLHIHYGDHASKTVQWITSFRNNVFLLRERFSAPLIKNTYRSVLWQAILISACYILLYMQVPVIRS